MHYIKKISSYAMVGGLGALLVMGITGCEKKEQEQNQHAFSEAAQKQGAFVVIEETAPGKYKIVEEYPSSQTRVILRELNGTERILSKEELDRLVKAEAAKIEANQSPLTNPSLQSSGGMGLAETILASAAGAIIGSWIGSKLFGNPTYQQQRQQSYKNPTVYERSKNAFSNKKSSFKPSSTTKKSGFFAPKKSLSTKRSFFSFGG